MTPRPSRSTSSGWDHPLGRRPARQDWTVYVVEPHANAVYADAALPEGFTPVDWAMDVEPDYQADDRQDLLVFDGEGTVAAIDVGSHAFAWRLPGVIAGVLMAVCLYALARILFARRSVAVAVAGLAVVEGMFFVQSRIGMNDAYVGPVHRGRLHAVRRDLDRLVAGSLRVLAGDAGRSACCSGSRSRRSGSPPTPSGRWCCCCWSAARSAASWPSSG